MGRSSKDQGDFGAEVGCADMGCVSPLGAVDHNKYYHIGVLQDTRTKNWFVYTEWGRGDRIRGTSWADDRFTGQNFQFRTFTSESDARREFKKIAISKNTRRLVSEKVGNTTVWKAKAGKSGYLVRPLAMRTTGLPDGYSKLEAPTVVIKSTSNPVEALARDLSSGVQKFATKRIKESGIVPTTDAITRARDEWLPLALEKYAKNKEADKDPLVQNLSVQLSSSIPFGSFMLISPDSVARIDSALQVFESYLTSISKEAPKQTKIDPRRIFDADISWLDPKSEKGKWVADTYKSMTNNRHAYLNGDRVKVLNVFEVSRPREDEKFDKALCKIAEESFTADTTARLQPAKRIDLSDDSVYKKANTFFGVHGTRAVNIQPILASNLRLPTQVSGVHITGAAFGHGIYFATDIKKSYGYTGGRTSFYGSGGGIENRGVFMFLSDVIMGRGYRAVRTGSWKTPPSNCHSIFAYPEYASVANDEHIIFNGDHQRIRYLVETTWR